MQANSSPPPVEVRDLRKSFGDQKVLNGISLSVPRGQIIAVLGRSGTGKSVLLKLLVGLQPPDSGSIQIGGREITHLDPGPLDEIRKKMGCTSDRSTTSRIYISLKRYGKTSRSGATSRGT